MRRWVVFNRFRTSDSQFFHVYVEAEGPANAREGARAFFEFLSMELHNTDPAFTDPGKFTAIAVSP